MKTKLLFSSDNSAFAQLNRLLKGKSYKGSRFFIIVDENSYNHCLPALIANVSALEQAEFFEVPVGEEAKSLEVAAQLWGALLDSGADRNSVIVNLGGGCVSDLGGFVAAAFKRGIRYVNIPTSLVGMVDAAIGGKTAVNIEGGKNQVGFFRHPEAVCFHTDFLHTLERVDWDNGLIEMYKTFLLSDRTYSDSLESFDAAVHVRGEEGMVWPDFIRQCVDFKSSVVSADPEETSLRKILNLGHTFGHAIESYSFTKGNPVSHGSAVGIGLLCELYLSVKKLGFSKVDYDKASRFINRHVKLPRFTLRDTEEILSFMRQDKKNHDGLILCVLLQDIAVPVIDVCLDENEVRDALLHVGKDF